MGKIFVPSGKEILPVALEIQKDLGLSRERDTLSAILSEDKSAKRGPSG